MKRQEVRVDAFQLPFLVGNLLPWPLTLVQKAHSHYHHGVYLKLWQIVPPTFCGYISFVALNTLDK